MMRARGAMAADELDPKGSGLKNPEYREQDMLGISLRFRPSD